MGGLQASPALIAHEGAQEGVAIELSPLGSRALFGMPARALWSTSLELEEVAGAATRSPHKVEALRELGAEPVVCDVFDASGLIETVKAFRPELVMHQLTDLPDQVERIPEFAARNNRIRTEGTRNLLAAARAAAATRFLAQSIAWTPPAGGEAVAEHERLVLDAGGVVVRYGMFYGPGTYSGSDGLPPPPRIHVDEAARRTVALLEAPSGVVVVADDDEGHT